MRINISEKNTYLIYNAVSKIKDSVYQQAIPRINQDNLSKENIELLAAIYKKWELLNVIETLKVDFEEINKVVILDIETIKKQKWLIGSLFQSKFEKEKTKTLSKDVKQNYHSKILDNMNVDVGFSIFDKVNREAAIHQFVKLNAS